MTYVLIISYILFYTYSIKIDTEWKSYLIYFLPIGLLLIMILGLQKEVGTDYQAYLQLAEGVKDPGWIERKNEILFIFLLNIVKKTNTPQSIFFIVGFIQVFFFSLITFEIRKKKLDIYNFFFLYFTLALIFYNQFNGIRQYIAVYIVIYGVLQMANEKIYKTIFCIILASLFHMSAVYISPLILIQRILFKKLEFKYIFVFLLFLLLLSFLDLNKYINFFLEYTKYKHYIGSNYLSKIPIQNILTKIPKIAIVLYTSYKVYNYESFKNKYFLINMSYLALAVQILSFNSTMVWRIYQYFDFFIIFPPLIYFSESKEYLEKYLIKIILIIMLLLKILAFPSGEYLYKSILF